MIYTTMGAKVEVIGQEENGDVRVRYDDPEMDELNGTEKTFPLYALKATDGIKEIMAAVKAAQGEPPPLEEMLEQDRDMSQELQPALDQLKALKKRIQEHVLETGQIAEVEGAKVSIRRGYTRVSYDRKKLDGLALAYPAIADCRTEREIGPAAVVKVG